MGILLDLCPVFKGISGQKGDKGEAVSSDISVPFW